MLQKIAERIKSLPPLPKTFYQVSTLCNDPNSSVYQLAQVLEQDPMLVANLLRVANSPLYSFRNEVKSVLQAASLFGMSTTRSLVADMSIKKLLTVDMEPYNITPEIFAQISRWQSVLMNQWYKSIDMRKLDILSLAALLQETGKILIADEIMKGDEVYQFKAELKNSNNIATVEKAFTGISSAEVTALIFEHWRFEPLIVEAIRFSENYEEAPEEVRAYAFALKVVKSALPINAPFQEHSLAVAVYLLQKEGMDDISFINVYQAMKETSENTYRY